ncbi:MAG TPA: aerial mycelium formation protein [Actinomycetota bacterium]|nr:aerial mycelium formation protein [Actinomycetota bacterium]
MGDKHDRREDRILDPSYLSDLKSATTAEVRSRRDECRELEGELSYARRLLQGKLDILSHELRRRSQGAEGDDGMQQLIQRLPAILSDEPPAVSQHRLVEVELPANAGKHRRQIDQLATGLANIEALSSEELSSLVDRLSSAERKISTDRRRAQEVIDGLNAELVRRYRDGEEDPSALLTS